MAAPTRVTIENTGESYDCQADSCLLDAGLDAGLHIPHSCRGGACGTCKAELLDGEVDHGWDLGFVLSDEEKAAGFCLACQAKPRSATVRLRMVGEMIPRGAGEEAIVPAEFSAEIVAARPVTPSVLRLVVAVPRTVKFRFHAGMNMEFVLPGIDRPRPYSMACAPDAQDGAPDGQLAFYVTRHPHGRASGWLHANARPGRAVSVRGPYGDFHFPPDVDGPVLCLAGGTGLSPILALIDKALRDGLAAPIELIFSVRDMTELFVLDALDALERRYTNFHYRITLTRDAGAAIDAKRLSERIPALLAREGRDLSQAHVLIAGSPSFVDDCAAAVKEHGAASARIRVDSFVPRGAVTAPSDA
ncbi:MAG: 2Fe-2S iron-sulfur cluster binding domain-containing protein [Rhodospirillales bacterium]|nr:2Fe-2S iron-sulfur cluster binding domain-containing protein [Rhodospirillales bacterium]